MSTAATQYYGTLLTQGYGSHQIKTFEEAAKRAERGEISHNKAYRLACKAGFGGFSNMTEQEASDSCESVYEELGAEAFNKCRKEALEGKKGGFGDWMKAAQDAGWIDKGLGVLGGFISNNQSQNKDGRYYQQVPPKKNNTALYVVGGLALVGIGVAIYYVTKKK
jgi:hypothetical protein